jgi:hypothetical protein
MVIGLEGGFALSNGFWAGAATAAILFLGALLIVLNQSPWVANINDSIALASTVFGFLLTVVGGVRTLAGVTGSFGVAATEVIPSGAAAIAGAVVLLASRFIGG